MGRVGEGEGGVGVEEEGQGMEDGVGERDGEGFLVTRVVLMPPLLEVEEMVAGIPLLLRSQ